ncbi:MAG: MFS transporter [Gammaproteobacteria bacterium]|nr:MFS transporter [Gammaproteobacteria bacterium]
MKERDTTQAGAGYPPTAYAWYVVGVLTLAYIVSFLDRQILALLIQPIRQDLGLSDTQISLLGGFAFALFYTLLGIPIGRLADRRSRRTIIAVGATLWCMMTAACGLARNFWQLFLARVGVGVGEATLNPSALSLISDYFPRSQRGRAIGVYNMGISLGVGLANIVGAWAIDVLGDGTTGPFAGTLKPWQTVFVLVGLPGLVVALLMLTVREPRRQDLLQASGEDGMSLADTWRYLRKRWRTYATHFIGMSVATVIGYGFFLWVPTLFVRSWGWTIPEAGYTYGMTLLVTGPIGVLLGGWIADRLYQRGYADALMRTCVATGVFVFVPASVLMPLMPSTNGVIALLALSNMGGALMTATGVAALMMLTPNEMRGQVTAAFYFVISALGMTVGPTAVALITDYGFGDDAALPYSIAWMAAGAGVVGLTSLVANLRLYRAGVIEVESRLRNAS